MIQHANTSLNKNAPPEPNRPPPEEDDDEQSMSSHSYVGESTEGHDVEFHDSANSVDGEPTTGIISKNSVNFQVRANVLLHFAILVLLAKCDTISLVLYGFEILYVG